jgi:crotonobetainyl-CoA:carnitine CoA-transferase CaiB-like acyl-CoA transferase
LGRVGVPDGVRAPGEHNREVYAEIGLDAAELERLSEAGVI